jgi:hypothetical protein
MFFSVVYFFPFIYMCVQQVFPQNLYTFSIKSSEHVDLMLKCEYKCKTDIVSISLGCFVFSPQHA